MKIILFLISQICNDLNIQDGEPFKIQIDGTGKNFLNFNVDSENFIINLKDEKIIKNKQKLPTIVSNEMNKQNYYSQILEKELPKEQLEIESDLQIMSPPQQKEMIKNLKIKILTDNGINFEEALTFLKDNEKDFDKQNFKLTIQEFIEEIKEILESDRSTKQMIDILNRKEEEMNYYLKEIDKFNLELEDEEVVTLIKKTIEHLFEHFHDFIENLNDSEEFEENKDIEVTLIALETEIDKINQFQNDTIRRKGLFEFEERRFEENYFQKPLGV